MGLNQALRKMHCRYHGNLIWGLVLGILFTGSSPCPSWGWSLGINDRCQSKPVTKWAHPFSYANEYCRMQMRSLMQMSIAICK